MYVTSIAAKKLSRKNIKQCLNPGPNILTKTRFPYGYTYWPIVNVLYPNIKWERESIESNTVEDKFIENIRDNFLFQHITMPTRGRLGNTSNILDLIFTNEEGMIEDVMYESPLGTK